MINGPFLTLPNLISLARVPLAGLAVAALVLEARLAAQGLMLAAFLTDALDGAVARATGSTSEWGRILDPMADKLVFAVLGGALAWMHVLPWWLVAVVVGRDLLVTVFGLRHMGHIGQVPTSKALGRASTLLLASFMFVQSFWPARHTVAGLGVLGWLAVLALALSTADYGWHYVTAARSDAP
ncbi:MAG: CDP-alcohol phosphatidyltransferase family protein [Nannocystaceae bacterium]